MAKARKENANGSAGLPATDARSTTIASAGVHTGEDFANLMSALMSDVIEGRVSPGIANAACNAGGKLLKVVEMQYRYGGQTKPTAVPSLLLASRRESE